MWWGDQWKMREYFPFFRENGIRWHKCPITMLKSTLKLVQFQAWGVEVGGRGDHMHFHSISIKIGYQAYWQT